MYKASNKKHQQLIIYPRHLQCMFDRKRRVADLCQDVGPHHNQTASLGSTVSSTLPSTVVPYANQYSNDREDREPLNQLMDTGLFSDTASSLDPADDSLQGTNNGSSWLSMACCPFRAISRAVLRVSDSKAVRRLAKLLTELQLESLEHFVPIHVGTVYRRSV